MAEATKSTINLGSVAADKPIAPFGPAVGAPSALTPAQAKDTPREKTVKMFFPRRVHLTVAHGKVVEFNPGQQDVPHHLSNHPYLKAHGAYVYHAPKVDPDLLKKAEGDAELAASQQARDAKFAQLVADNKPKVAPIDYMKAMQLLRFRGYSKAGSSPDEAKAFIDRFNEQELASFLKDLEAFDPAQQQQTAQPKPAKSAAKKSSTGGAKNASGKGTK